MYLLFRTQRWDYTRYVIARNWWRNSNSGNGHFNEELFDRIIEAKSQKLVA
jgi:hypothetical protein